MEIVFLTLFLSVITTGTRTVQIQAPPGTAAVVFRLDGEQAAGLTGPPWSVVVDFGEELLPHELEASAFDSEGKLLAIARQAVNMPHSLAEAYLAVEITPNGRRVARLRWNCAVATRPRDVRLTFDGERLDVTDPSTFVVPRFEAGTAHILRAELDFGSNVTAMAEALVGSKDRDYASAELTAVPVVPTENRKRLDPADLANALAARGKTLKIVAVEEGPAEVVFVVDPGAEQVLDEWTSYHSRSRFWLDREVLFYFVFPAPSTYVETRFEIFPCIGPLNRSNGGLLDTYWRERNLHTQRDPEYLPGAAQISGVWAVMNSRRRAAVWILGPNRSVSDRSLKNVRGFVRALNVPLLVWRVFPKDEPVEVAEGETPVSTRSQLTRAIDSLESLVKRQRLVWVEGRHLPQTIDVSVAATGIAVAR